jgi:hypothetical protein
VDSRGQWQPCWFAVATLTFARSPRFRRRSKLSSVSHLASSLAHANASAVSHRRRPQASKVAKLGAVAIRAVGARELHALLLGRSETDGFALGWLADREPGAPAAPDYSPVTRSYLGARMAGVRLLARALVLSKNRAESGGRARYGQLENACKSLIIRLL